ncbi:hypothetical protein [Nocardiopsis synnemataformans]|uniref:hypothetical protein n=1 Tax=Nocardiopsis synnemataformans TaxID=61305 RepID=UPI003EBE0660
MQEPTSPDSTPEPRLDCEVRTVWTPPQQATADTWRCTGCATYVLRATTVCDTCGTAYDYAADPRLEHAVLLVWPDGDVAEDAVKAATPAEALEAARANWPAAAVTLIDREAEAAAGMRTHVLTCTSERAARALVVLAPRLDEYHRIQALPGGQVRVRYVDDVWLERVALSARHHRLINTEAFAPVEEAAAW